MSVWRTLLASFLGLCTLVPTVAPAETVLAALDWPRPTAPRPDRELDCLALNIYWEARSESLLGRIAVAAVTLNRVAAPAFPDGVCAVVFQGEDLGRHMCQFSWRCDGRTDRPRNLVAWEEARRVARLALSDGVDDPTGGALWYHADHVLPAWAGEMTLQAQIGHHLFYNLAASRETLAALEQVKSDLPSGPPGRLVLPSPVKPVLPPWPTATRPEPGALMAALAELKIDFEPDPTAGLLLCDSATLCGALATRAAPLRTPRTAPVPVDARLQMVAEPDPGTDFSESTDSPMNAVGDPIS